MKIAFAILMGLSICALLAISAFQLFTVVVREMISMVTEAWYSPEQH
jgi:hypothetical protein